MWKTVCDRQECASADVFVSKYIFMVKISGGVFLACEDFGRMLDNSLPACAFFFFF